MKNSYSVKTILRKDKKKKDGTCPLNYRIILNGKLLRLPVGVSLRATEWDKENGCPKGKNLVRLKQKLGKREAEFKDFMLDCELAEKPLNLTVVKEFYKGGGKNDFYVHFDEFCKRKFKTIKPGTQYHYLLLRKQLKKFQSDLYIKDIDYKFLINFFDHLSEKAVGESGIATRRKTLVCVLEEFVKLKLIQDNPCKEIPRPKENERDEFLSLSELKIFSEVNLNIGSMADGLNLTRDLFLFSCYTGLRYSDVINLKKDEVKKNRIEIVMQKTNKKIEIPLNKKAKEILRRFKGRKFAEQVFPFRSNVSVNRDLKFIARRAKVYKRISFHTGRHTFGSTLAKNNVQPFYIMKLMGHTDVRMTNRYVNSDSEMITNAMNRVNFG